MKLEFFGTGIGHFIASIVGYSLGMLSGWEAFYFVLGGIGVMITLWIMISKRASQ
jgi:predicted MFS family arabinose efflux permease